MPTWPLAIRRRATATSGSCCSPPKRAARGFGKALLALLEEEARARGTERLFVGVVQANAPARAFWLREGFMPVKTLGPLKVGARTHLVDRMGKSLAR